MAEHDAHPCKILCRRERPPSLPRRCAKACTCRSRAGVRLPVGFLSPGYNHCLMASVADGPSRGAPQASSAVGTTWPSGSPHRSGGIIDVRRAAEGDAEIIASLHVAASRVGYRGMLPKGHLESLSVTDHLSMWTGAISRMNSRHVVLMASLDGRGVGFAAVGPTRDDGGTSATGELRALYVDPVVWRRGIGSALVDSAVGVLAAFFTDAMLWVLRQNIAARTLYESCGWAEDGGERRVLRGGALVNEVRYRRALS